MQTRFTPDQLADSATAAAAAIVRACVHCGFCTATCPTYVLLGDELDSPRGRITLMQNMLESQAVPSADVVKHIDRCLSCLACMTTCPSGVHYGHLVDHARGYIAAHYRRPWFDRLVRAALATILPHPRRFRAALTLARLVRPVKGLIPLTGTFAPLASMLALAPRQGAARRPQVDRPAAMPRRGRVVLMKGCAEPVLRPEIGAATERLLTRMGHDVRYTPREGCCGALTHHMGREGESLAMVRRNVDAWLAESEAGLDAIIVTASGCGTTVRDYGWLLRDDPDYAAKAARVSALAQDISAFVATVGLPPVNLTDAPRIAYHSACSMQHGQQLDAVPRGLLTAAGFAVTVPAEAHLCCGSAGTYNILQPKIAGQLGRPQGRQSRGAGRSGDRHRETSAASNRSRRGRRRRSCTPSSCLTGQPAARRRRAWPGRLNGSARSRTRGRGHPRRRPTRPATYSAEPRPKPAAPAARHGAMPSAVMPPTGRMWAAGGSTARIAFSTAGLAASAGNSLSAWAPAASAAKASVGVAMPGSETRPAATLAAITLWSALGEMIIVPPASPTRPTSACASTVPAPTTARSPTRAARRAMLSKGSGELSGTSISVNPPAISASATATTSSGRMPRRMAISGQRANAWSKAARLLMTYAFRWQ